MLRKLREVVTPVIVLLLAAFIIYWKVTSIDLGDDAMSGVPRHDNFDDQSILASENISNKLEPSYLKYLQGYRNQHAVDTSGVNIVMPASSISMQSSSGVDVRNDLDGVADAVALTEEGSWVEYSIEIPQDGFYQMGMTYYALPGKRSSVQRSVQIDGKYPFFQAKRLEFPRMWHEIGTTRRDNQANELSAKQEEVFGWQYRDLMDAEGKSAEPLRFALTKGKHVIRINMMREPAAIGELRIFSPYKLPSYAEVAEQYKINGYKRVDGVDPITLQAENAILKSDPTIRRVENRDPATVPFNSKAIELNTFGGVSWRLGGQSAEWEFEVPEDGLYEIGMRFGSFWQNGMPVQRTVRLDGQIPFAEMQSVTFDYSRNWQFKVLGVDRARGDAEESTEPAQFYLTKGKHRLSMEVQVGSLGPVFENIQDVSLKMSYLAREVIHVTGTDPDKNRDWELDKNITNLVPRLETMAWDLQDAIDMLVDIGVNPKSSELSPLKMARNQILSLSQDTSTIPARLQQFGDTQSSLGRWVQTQSEQGVQLDYFVIKSVSGIWPKATAGSFSKFVFGVKDFLHSFVKDYNGVGNVYGDQKTLDVWIARGRDWASIIKQMADEQFTPETNIKVNINVIPVKAMNLLMLANTSGRAPDVALGVEPDVPIDFAIRDGLVNLNQFADYPDIASRFRPGALTPYRYNGGDYALPENQNFFMLFYRKDIMEQLGVTGIPETWQEVMELIPLLQQNGMDFYYPHTFEESINQFAPFLFQNGGDFYTDGGEKSRLDSPEAHGAVKMWTGLYTNYKISKEANFYNRFRTGEMPIGVADYNTYVLLSTAAPELTGWWEMKPMPGIRQEDGQINRSTGGLAQTGVIFSSSEKQDDAWLFLKWWTDADTQVEFGTELESLLGVEARWNTANVEAIQRLPWAKSDIEAIMEQWQWFREREIVPGGYYTNRHVANIWNEIVLTGKISREAVEDGVKEINKELRKKREEFGIGGGKP